MVVQSDPKDITSAMGGNLPPKELHGMTYFLEVITFGVRSNELLGFKHAKPVCTRSFRTVNQWSELITFAFPPMNRW